MKAKRLINILYGTNKVVYLLTLGLFVTIYLGFLFEMLLGTVQALSSLLLLFTWKEMSKEQKKQLLTYWGCIGIYLFLWIFNWEFVNEWILYIIGIGIIPMGIGTFFLSILRSMSKISFVEPIENIELL